MSRLLSIFLCAAAPAWAQLPPRVTLDDPAFSVMTDPAAMVLPAPMVNGATRMESEPMKQPSSMVVWCLARPS